MFYVFKLVIFDCDGVINCDSDQFIKLLDEWIVFDGSLEVIVELNQVGYQVVVVINQLGIGCGLFEVVVFNVMYEKMYKVFVIYGGCVDVVFFCLYIVVDVCECCKFKFGMFCEIVCWFDMDFMGVLVVGDLLCDL